MESKFDKLVRKKVLVTGGFGFIGSHLVDRLLGLGCRVRVFDNLSTGFEANLSHARGKFESVIGDLRDLMSLRNATRGCDYVFHLAALNSVVRSIDDPLSTIEVNVTGTANILEAAREAKAKRVIFSSSSSVYGDSKELVKSEAVRGRTLSPYALTQYIGEELCHQWHLHYGLQSVSLRYFNVFGPRQSKTSAYAAVIPRIIEAIETGGTFTIFGDGLQSRDFTPVANVVLGNLLAAVSDNVRGGEILNVALGKTISLLELIAKIETIAQKKLKVVFAPERKGDVRNSKADISLASGILGYSPIITLDEGLRELVSQRGSNPKP
ncbi:MAG: NAD-dependent epimerase/dehydratase family protein [Planctomycetes bacterium]|nr:NAD-dependent epimerase/dehydratase family protein [Planctomycetota bacterium]